jgi:hypothetical protein
MKLKSAVLVALMWGMGCGSPQQVATVDPLDDASEALTESISEALGAIREASAPRDPDDEERRVSVPGALAEVVATARAFASAAAGKPTEADAKSILASAQELEKQARASAPAAQLSSGLERLRAKLAARAAPAAK